MNSAAGEVMSSEHGWSESAATDAGGRVVLGFGRIGSWKENPHDAGDGRACVGSLPDMTSLTVDKIGGEGNITGIGLGFGR